MIGSRILREAVGRGHQVVAIVRKPEAVPAEPGVRAVGGDALDPASIAATAAGAAVAVSAFGPQAGHDDDLSKNAHALIAGLAQASVPRVIVVGGAGSLEVPPGVKVIDTPQFPAAYKAEAGKGGEFLELLRKERDLDWTFLSPSALFVAGERTGKFRLGKDQLLSNEKGSSISFEDYAIALVDEIERPAHSRQRFTVGY